MGSKSILERLRQTTVASLSDAMDKQGTRAFMSNRVKPLSPGMKMAGRAITVGHIQTKKPEPPMIALEAIDKAGPGKVLVYAVEPENDDVALMGGLMATAAKAAKVEGVVCGGSIRDVSEVRALGLTVFCESGVPSSTVGRTRTVKMNVPIKCGGVTVKPGDYVVGGDDGVVVIPADKVNRVLKMAEEIDDIERREAVILARGESIVETVKKFARL
jgi:3-hexulose-6-phosphate synthase/6-phospho-3-hexuloisomerase